MTITAETLPLAEGRAPSVEAVYAAHCDFVWLTLQRLGVEEASLDDLLQEVFVVVHRRLGSFDGSAKMTTWLYGICVRVASVHRRSAPRRRERAVEVLPEPASSVAAPTPEDAVSREQLLRQMQALLDELDCEKRAVFVMHELEEMRCEDIAALIGVPLGTVHSRLRAARQAIQRAVLRWRAAGGQR